MRPRETRGDTAMTVDLAAARLARSFTLSLLCSAWLTSCGGGGGSNGAATPPPPPPPAVNHAPQLSLANGRQTAVIAHEFRYDATQDGRTFTDADGDALVYELTFTYFADASNQSPSPANGLRVEGNLIVGAPEGLGIIVAYITATDDENAWAADEFWIDIVPNGSPASAQSHADQLVQVGDLVDLDASLGGAAFVDPEGDEITYEVTLRGEPRGLSVSGTRVSGIFDSVGLVEVTLHARDAYGGAGSDRFLIAAPAVEPEAPTLPDPPYAYRDEAFPLPHAFRESSDDSTPLDDPVSDEIAMLGRVLFHDKRLSITNQVSCSSCHEQSRGFASSARFSSGALGVPQKRQAMPLANVRYNSQRGWFSDMRVHTLEELVLEPFRDPEELGGSVELAVSKLRATSFYPPLFESAFGTPEITDRRVARALAHFLRSIISYRSKYDLALNPMDNTEWNPAAVFDEREMRGFDLVFSGEARCAACHDLQLSHNIWQANNGLDVEPSDPGALDPSMSRGFVGVFRPASLRNIEVTGPYMHDGRFATLRDVINHYDHGIQDSQNLDGLLFSFTGGPMRLNLSEEDKDALEAFLKTMTDPEFLTDPRFSDPFAD